MLCYSKIRKIKYFLDTLPPPKKRLNDTNGRDVATRTSVCLYQQRVTWIFTRLRLNRLSDSDSKLCPLHRKLLSNYSRFFRPTFQHLIFLYIRIHTQGPLTLNHEEYMHFYSVHRPHFGDVISLWAATNESKKTLNKCETRNKTVFHTRLRHPETINSVPVNSVLRIKQIGV